MKPLLVDRLAELVMQAPSIDALDRVEITPSRILPRADAHSPFVVVLPVIRVLVAPTLAGIGLGIICPTPVAS